MLLACLGLVVALGAAIQRMTGMGFALVASPLLVLVLGPVHGVMLTNLCGVTIGCFVIATMRSDVNWPLAAKLATGAIIGVIPGALLSAMVDRPTLAITIGVIVVVSMIGTAIAARSSVILPHASVFVAGGFSGLLSASAGLGGPPISAWAAMSPPQKNLAVTLQPYFALTAFGSIVAKLCFDGVGSLPNLQPVEWVIVAVALGVGTWSGQILAPKLSDRRTKQALILIAVFGGIALIVSGLQTLSAA